MALNQEQIDKVSTWLRDKGFRGCTACGSNNFSTGEIVSVPTMSGGGLSIGGPTVPLVQVICNNCAHVHHFAAVALGLAG